MDCFIEEIVVKRNRMMEDIMYVLCWIVLIFAGLYALLALQVVFYELSVMSVMMLVLSAASAVLMYFVKDNFKVEYEYSFTNGTLDFARVYRGARRKELGSMRVKNVLACGHVTHESFRKFLAMKDVERRNWFLNRDANLFYFYYEKEGKKHMIIIEPSEDMVQGIKTFVPAGVYQG